MKNNILASFNVVESGLVTKPVPKISFEIGDESTLEDMFEAFKNFLLALGYVIPHNSYIDVVEDDFTKINNSDLSLINESNYKGEF